MCPSLSLDSHVFLLIAIYKYIIYNVNRSVDRMKLKRLHIYNLLIVIIYCDVLDREEEARVKRQRKKEEIYLKKLVKNLSPRFFLFSLFS